MLTRNISMSRIIITHVEVIKCHLVSTPSRSWGQERLRRGCWWPRVSSAEVRRRSEDDVGGRDAAVVIRVAAELGEAAARAPEHVASGVETAPCEDKTSPVTVAALKTLGTLPVLAQPPASLTRPAASLAPANIS